MKPASNSGLSRLKRHLLGIPEPVTRPDQFVFGSEAHSMWLENGKRETYLTAAEEEQLTAMVASLQKSAAQRYIEHPKVQLEVVLEKKLAGVPCLGKLDIFNKQEKVIADLKTTSTNNPDLFLASAVAYDYFRQAYFYQRLTGVEKFLFIAVSKVAPYRVHLLDVSKYPRQMYAAKQEFDFLLHFYGKHYAV